MFKVDENKEVAIKIGNGFLVFPDANCNPLGCDYVRFVTDICDEIAYWTADQWQRNPIQVMGEIMGMINKMDQELI